MQPRARQTFMFTRSQYTTSPKIVHNEDQKGKLSTCLIKSYLPALRKLIPNPVIPSPKKNNVEVVNMFKICSKTFTFTFHVSITCSFVMCFKILPTNFLVNNIWKWELFRKWWFLSANHRRYRRYIGIKVGKKLGQ